MMGQGLGPGSFSLWDRKGKKSSKAASHAIAKTIAQEVMNSINAGELGVWTGENWRVYMVLGPGVYIYGSNEGWQCSLSLPVLKV